ncbi:uncharacterized protein LOC142061109 [Phalacrocorax aristotelis]|uniref:uncharacterized protein LOC142061109 n=1 Tax=Phalacrocorax aristotelis TaxID=126867 RepID=UPI003F4C6DFE
MSHIHPKPQDCQFHNPNPAPPFCCTARDFCSSKYRPSSPLLCLFQCIAAEKINLIHRKAKCCFGSCRSVHVSPIYHPPPPPLANAIGVESHDPSPLATVAAVLHLHEPRPSGIQPARTRRRGWGGQSNAASFQTAPPAFTFLEATGCLCGSPGARRQRVGKASADSHHVTQLSVCATWSRHPPPPIPAPPPTPAHHFATERKAFKCLTTRGLVCMRAGKGEEVPTATDACCLPLHRWISALQRVCRLSKTSSVPCITAAPTPPSPSAPIRTKKALYALQGLISITSEASGTCTTTGWQYIGLPVPLRPATQRFGLSMTPRYHGAGELTRLVMASGPGTQQPQQPR